MFKQIVKSFMKQFGKGFASDILFPQTALIQDDVSF